MKTDRKTDREHYRKAEWQRVRRNYIGKDRLKHPCSIDFIRRYGVEIFEKMIVVTFRESRDFTRYFGTKPPI